MRGLYPIVDLSTCARHGLDPIDVARAILPACPPVLQLRAKRATPRETLALLRKLVALTRGSQTLLFANDRPDLALMAGCDGVHLGQDDAPIEAVRALAPNLRVGLSSHTQVELELALQHAPDYVAYGPVFATSTKSDAEAPVGIDGLRAAHRIATGKGIPLVAIGGLTLDAMPNVAPHADLVCVISALMAPTLSSVTERATQLQGACKTYMRA
jgi:thiamine-phosphate pyrophosphorylase